MDFPISKYEKVVLPLRTPKKCKIADLEVRLDGLDVEVLPL
jgi:hypothetical protein